jgi:GH15 family glucan-1,4-alpha-glucosidase
VQELPETNSKFLQLCSKQKDIKIMALYIKKTPSYNPNSNEKHILYNHIASILLKKLVEKKILSTNESIEFIASRRETKKMLNTMFISCLWETAKKANLNIKISIKPPQEEKGLQVVDVLCWSIYQKYEHQQQYYSSIIASQIIILEELKNPIRTLP